MNRCFFCSYAFGFCCRLWKSWSFLYSVIVYYDPLKLISKLGAKHIKDWDHLEEFRRSLCDVANSLNNCAYYTQLDDAVSEVHKTAPPGSFVYKSLVKYLSDKVLFRSLFIDGSC